MSERRIVVTGMGLVTPLGTGVEAVWRRLLEGRSGIVRLSDETVADLPGKVGGIVPLLADDPEAGFDADAAAPPKEQKKMDRFILFALAAAQEAVKQAGWAPSTEEERERTATIIGSGIGGFVSISDAVRTTDARGPRRLSPFTIPSFLVNLAAGHVSIQHGFKGPLGAPVTACAAGVQAIGDAARMILAGEADVAICGGAEACIDRVALGGFAAARALSSDFNETPERASRPFDRDRDGFVMGEGAGCVVLEEYEHAVARGAKIYGEYLGYGLSGDAYHITAPDETMDGGFRSMKAALERAGLEPADIDYINAHGTSTPRGDEIELRAVKRIFGAAAYDLSMSSTKSSIGHLLGAAGSVEAIFSIMAMIDGVVPPTINLDNPSVETEMDLVPHTKREKDVKIALSNSFGFGGTNAALVFKHPDA